MAFNETKLIAPCVRQFKKPYLEEDIYHLVLVSRKPWHGDYEYDPDTVHVAIEHGADLVLTHNWSNQAEQFNYGLEALANEGFEWAIICDADEFYTPIGAEGLFQDIRQAEDDNIVQLRAPEMQVYWKHPFYVISNRQTDTPVVAIRTDQNFSDKRTPALSEYGCTYSVLHHFSYVRTDEEILKKINSFEHSNEFDKEKWYNLVWKKWTPGMTNLHPVVPTQFERAIYANPPISINKNFITNK